MRAGELCLLEHNRPLPTAKLIYKQRFGHMASASRPPAARHDSTSASRQTFGAPPSHAFRKFTCVVNSFIPFLYFVRCRVSFRLYGPLRFAHFTCRCRCHWRGAIAHPPMLMSAHLGEVTGLPPRPLPKTAAGPSTSPPSLSGDLLFVYCHHFAFALAFLHLQLQPHGILATDDFLPHHPVLLDMRLLP